MADLASFWTGDSLGPIEIASLRSFLRHGDRITIYALTKPGNLPAGVALQDAALIMPCGRILRHHRSGSPAPHSDLFRYALMARTDHIWVDLDVIALRPFDFPSEWVFGFESVEVVNNAILRLPRTSATLKALMELGPDTIGYPPGIKGLRHLKYRLRSLGRGVPIDRWHWGATGPEALTYHLQRTGEIRHALPQSAFYVVPWQDAQRFAHPGGVTRDDLPPNAWAVHLWGQHLRRVIAEEHQGAILTGSFLDLALRGTP